MDSQEHQSFFNDNHQGDENSNHPTSDPLQPKPNNEIQDTQPEESQQSDAQNPENPQNQNIIMNNDQNLPSDSMEEPINLTAEVTPEQVENLESTHTPPVAEENPDRDIGGDELQSENVLTENLAVNDQPAESLEATPKGEPPLPKLAQCQ